MKLDDLNYLTKTIHEKLGTNVQLVPCGVNYVHVNYRDNRYRITTSLMVEKVGGSLLRSDDDARQLEKLLRGEQWNGTGIPPVGTEVECRCDEGDIKCVALGYDFNNTAVVLRDIERKTYFAAQTTMVRPLRTERDKAVEQIDNITGVFANTCISEKLYDAIVAGKIDGLGKVG